MGSIESAFIGLARYIGTHWGGLNWYPLWYGGTPFQDAYPPLLHVLVAGFSSLARVGPGLAYHAVTAAVYALAPVALYWAARRLGMGRAAAFLAALFYSLISPSCWLVRVIRHDAGGWFAPRRLVTLVRYGEGPHLLSLALLPVAVAALNVALERRRPVYYFLAAIAAAAVALSNWIGAFALALAYAAYLLAGYGKMATCFPYRFRGTRVGRRAPAGGRCARGAIHWDRWSWSRGAAARAPSNWNMTAVAKCARRSRFAARRREADCFG
jgi:hypothetical protein